jgi:autotransporter-associated beta strand protein/ELWxxDGT repeat protein
VLAIDAQLIADLSSGDSSPSGFVQYGGFTYFNTDDGVTGFELWRTDGISTSLFADLHETGSSNPKLLTVANGKLFFAAASSATGREVWVTDGVSPPQVLEVRAGTPGSNPSSLTSFNGEVYFAADNGTGLGVWHTDGVAAPSLVSGTAGLNPSEIVVSGGRLYFSATPTAPPSISRIYSFDGVSLQGINLSTGSANYGPSRLTDFSGTVYFSGTSPATGEELFKVSTPPAGPQVVDLVRDINPGSGDSTPFRFAVAGTNLFFPAYNGTAFNLWRTYSGGTEKVNDPIGVTIPTSTSFAAIGSLLYFVGVSASGKGIFSSDGTTITPLPATIGMNPDQLTNVAGQLYFTGTSPGTGNELWCLSGLTPTLVKDIQPGSGSSSPDSLTAIDSAIFFSANDGATGIEPWLAKDFSSPQTISQDAGGNLVVTDNANEDDDLTLEADGAGGWTITGPGANFGILGVVPAGVTASGNTIQIPASAAPSFSKLIINTNGGVDKLTVALAAGDAIPSAGVEYNGGSPAASPGDQLAITGGSQGTVTYEFTSSSDGSVAMSNYGTIQYTGLEPISNSGSASDVIFNLPAVASVVVLEDDGISGNTLSRLRSTPSTFETVDFSDPTNSLTINCGDASDTLTIHALPDFTRTLSVGAPANPFAAVLIDGPVSLAADKNLAIVAASLAVSGAVQTSGTSGISLTASGGGITIDGSLTVGAGGATLTANGGISGIGNITNSSSTLATLTIDQAGDSTFGGAIGGPAGGAADARNVALIKTGPGTLILSGANTYTGATTVEAGTLLVNASITSSVTVAILATLGGGGVITGNVGGAGTISAGSSPGVLTVNGDFAPGGILPFEINSPFAIAGSDYDQLAVNGSVILSGSSLSLITTGSPAPASPQTLVLIANDGNDPISGTFTGLPEGSSITIGATDFSISYVGGTGNDVVLNAAPFISPSLAATLSGGLLVIFDFDPSGRDNDLIIRRDGGNLVISDALQKFLAAPPGGSLSNGDKTITIPLALITGLTVNGEEGSDRMTVDYAGGSFGIPLVLSGGSPASLPGDSLVVTGAPESQPLVVDTSGGKLDAGGDPTLAFNGFEEVSADEAGLDTLALGNLYVRLTPGPDYLLVMSGGQLDPAVRLRIGNAYFPRSGGNYGPYFTAATQARSAGRVVVLGGDGVDNLSMYNTRLAAVFFGGAGNDILTGGPGNDLLVGGAGDDRINGAVVGGNDEIWGDDFNPAADDPAAASQAAGGNDTISTFAGADTIYGQGGNDLIYSGGGDDYVNGGIGADQIDGQAGNDRIYGGGDNDVLSGSDGHDLVAGNGGNDTLYGRTGNDILIGGLGQDIVNGHEGQDALVGDESNDGGSGSLAKNDVADAALLALLLSWGLTPSLGSLGAFGAAGSDGSIDTLWGGTAADCFFATGADQRPDRNAAGYGPDLN